MKNIFTVGRIGKITFSVHWTFLLLLLWIVAVNFLSGYSPEGMVWSILLFVSVVISILAHEAGHAIVARYFGIRANGVILLPIGGVASIPYLPKKPGHEILISLAGPAVNLLIAIFLLRFINPYGAYWRDSENIGAVNPGNFWFQLQLINLSLAIFNLIPSFPMDGGRILRILLGLNMNILKASRIAGIVSSIVAYGLIATGIIIINLLLVFLGIFILLAARAEEYYLQLKTVSHGLKLKDVVMHDYDSVDANATVMETSSILMTNHSRYFIVMENGKAVGTISRMQIVKSISEMKYDVKTKELMKANLSYLDGNSKVENLIEKLAGNEERLYPVLVQNNFAGLINFQHLMEYLLIHSASTKEYGRIKSLAGLV